MFDTAGTTLAQKAGVETDIGGSEPAVRTERQPFDAFAEMAGIPVRAVFSTALLAAQAAEREASPIEKGRAISNSRTLGVTRKDFTFPNPLHKPPGRS